MRLKVCICVYFFILVNCDEIKKVSANGTMEKINQTESTSLNETKIAVPTDKPLAATTATKIAEVSIKALTTERTTKSPAILNSRSVLEPNSRQMYVSNCPCSCDEPGYLSPSYSAPHPPSFSHASFYQPLGYMIPSQQASYATQTGYPSQASSYQPTYNVPQSNFQPLNEHSLPQQNYAAQNYLHQYYRSTFNAREVDSLTEEDRTVFRSYEPSSQQSSSYSGCGSNQMIACTPTVSYIPCSAYDSPSY